MEYVFTAPTSRGKATGYVTIEYDGKFWVIGSVYVTVAGRHRRAAKAQATAIRKHLYKHHALQINRAWLKWRGVEPHRSLSEYLTVRGVE